MKKKFLLIFIFLILLGSSSCIEIIQLVKVNPDQSGNITIAMDMGELNAMFIAVAENVIDLSVLDEIKQQPFKSAKIIENIKGIRNIFPESNDKKGLYGLSFDFENDKALNEALFKMFHNNDKPLLPKVFKIRKNRIKITNTAPIIRYFTNKYQKNMKDNELLSYVTYKQVYVLPGKVKKVKNKKSVIEEEKVIMSYTLEELLKKKINIGNKIKF